jgi:hypothetical protein
MYTYYNYNNSKKDKAHIIKILIPVGSDNVRLVKYCSINKSVFPLFLRLKLIEGRHQQRILRMTFITPFNCFFFWFYQM